MDDAARLERLERAVRAGQRMRTLQREYFKTRNRDVLVASKDAEREFDRLADEALSQQEGLL